MDYTALLKTLQDQGVHLAGGLLTLVLGLILVKWIMRLLERRVRMKHFDPTLVSFLRNLVKLVLIAVVVLTAVGVMGIPLTSFVTILASAGVAVSLALQGALGNFVGGVTMLILKPIKVGEYVKIGDSEGTVQAIGTFYTDLLTFDGRHISLPNSSLTNTAIVNFSREGRRRLDMVFSVSYGADIDRVKATLMHVVEKGGRYLPDPAPAVLLSQHADSSVQYTVRLWCASADYWDLYYFLLEEGKRALDAAGIEIPYPQMDVHLRSGQ